MVFVLSFEGERSVSSINQLSKATVYFDISIQVVDLGASISETKLDLVTTLRHRGCHLCLLVSLASASSKHPEPHSISVSIVKLGCHNLIAVYYNLALVSLGVKVWVFFFELSLQT